MGALLDALPVPRPLLRHHGGGICPCYIKYTLFMELGENRKVARRFSTSYLGQDLDSLADIISFGVAPAILGFCMGLNTTLDVVILILFVKYRVVASVGYARAFNLTLATQYTAAGFSDSQGSMRQCTRLQTLRER